MLTVALSGCSGPQSALDPKGPDASHLASLFWLFVAVSTVTFVLVMVALAIAALRRRHDIEGSAEPLEIDDAHDRRATMSVTGSVVATILVLIVLTVASFLTTHALTQSFAPDALEIKITGHQWWWEIEYEDQQPSRTLLTANEMHLPAGRPVRLRLGSNDVIHSFWAPNLMGKQDLIPGRENQIAFTPTSPGTYRAQCAEFCGLQHANMALPIVVEAPEAFEAWRNAQLKPAEPPSEPERRRGAEVFVSTACIMCHQIRGTAAAGRAGPDLTHVGSRLTLAAGTLPTSLASLAGWIADPQGVKPGNHMPTVSLSADDLNAVATYLDGLK